LFLILNLQAHRAHQIQSIAALHYARLQPVIEMQFAVLDGVGEVDVEGAAGESAGDVGQRQIVRGDQPQRAMIDEPVTRYFQATIRPPDKLAEMLSR